VIKYEFGGFKMFDQNPVFIPGPTNIPEIIRKACDIGSMDHRSPRFREILVPTLAGVKKVVGTTNGEVIIFPASGTGGWEAAITNTLCAGNTVLAARNGMFSHRWIDLCQRHGLDVQVIDAEWGAGLPVDRYEDALRADKGHKIKAVLATHNETATGVLSNIAAVRAALDAANHPALLFVDGVSSIGSVDFRMDDWGVDIAVTGSQKGFMLPAGLAIIAISQKAIAAIETATLSRTFFDIRDMRNSYKNGSYPYTPAVGLMNGLNTSLDLLLTEGLENVYARHHRIAEGVRKAVAAWGLKLCAKTPDIYSNTVSAVVVPAGFTGTDVVGVAAEKYGVAFGVGLGDVAGKVFRIGHLGAMSDVVMLSGLATAEMCMADLGYPIQVGSGVTAAQEYYRTRAAETQRKAA
jgi:alanine-glyoxylate transaminase/serine-glyoxylate transaminase/serine-pyruvate transaminase